MGPKIAPLATRWIGTMLAAVCSVIASAGPVGAADPEWSVGVAAVKITPEQPVVLAGYASRTKPHQSVDTDLYAKALALRDGAGNRAVLVTMDLCILPPAVAEPVRPDDEGAARVRVARLSRSAGVSSGAEGGTTGRPAWS